MAIVNTGRKIFEVNLGQVWRDKDTRGHGGVAGARSVRVVELTPTRAVVRNTRSNRLAKIHLQDFVARFDLESET